MNPRTALRNLVAVALLIGLTAGGDDRPAFRLTPEGTSGPVVLALIDIDRGYPNGEFYCPPDTNWETDICLGADIVIHPGTIEKRFGWSDNVDRKWEANKFKQIGAHAVRWVEGGRWIAVIEQTDADYWYIQWKVPIEAGRFCLSDAMITHYRLEAPTGLRRKKDGARCFNA
ncbi:MAG: hypothetical protein J0H88_09420 [Sphingomonadales bacterium]|nr:hypothetical protein [Sphingomonadales bacterium]